MSFQSLLNQLKESTQKHKQQTSKNKKENDTRLDDNNDSCSSSSNFKRKRSGNNELSLSTSTSNSRRKIENDRNKRIYNTNNNRQILPKDHHDLSIKVSFLGIGAQKAGLHEILNMHDSINLPSQKETHFWDWNRRKGLKWFSQQFNTTTSTKNTTPNNNIKNNDSVINGEITPCYAVLPLKDIKEIKMLFPNLKIIFLARDIVERTWSALTMELRNAVRGMEAGQFANIEKDNAYYDESEANPNKYDDDYFLERMKHSTHLLRSDYATSIRNWIQCGFHPSQILILNYEDISNTPLQVVEQVCTHIGRIDGKSFAASLGDETLLKRVNSAVNSDGGGSRNEIRPKLRKKMEDFLSVYAKDFNSLLVSLGYDWSMNEYNESK